MVMTWHDIRGYLEYLPILKPKNDPNTAEHSIEHMGILWYCDGIMIRLLYEHHDNGTIIYGYATIIWMSVGEI